jgi:hypothetical protein
MERFERDAVIAELIEQLHGRGSWCGETHVQKSMYLLQEIAGVRTGFDFILYKHGPFSFDLRDELTAMRADFLLELEVRRPDYGPSLKLTQNMDSVSRRYKSAVEEARPAIDFIGEKVGDKTVVELERLGTALYMRRRHPEETDTSALARKIVDLKPHISEPEAREAVSTVALWEEEAKSLPRSA